jgi:hypothetical protein
MQAKCSSCGSAVALADKKTRADVFCPSCRPSAEAVASETVTLDSSSSTLRANAPPAVRRVAHFDLIDLLTILFACTQFQTARMRGYLLATQGELIAFICTHKLCIACV